MNTIISLAFLFAIFGLIAYVVTIFNGLIALKNDIAKAWANIDILLKQRHDELSKLLDVCKGYMDYERDTCKRSRRPAASTSKPSASIKKPRLTKA